MGPNQSTGRVRRRGHKARLYPSTSQKTVLDGQAHAARAVWNLLHEWYTCRDGGIAKRPPIAEMDRQLRDARSKPLPDWEWLQDLPAQAMQQILKHYLRSWDRYFKGVVGPPRFKRRTYTMGVDVPQAAKLKVKRLGRRWGRVQIPFVGQVRFRWTRPLPGISRDCPGRITGARLVQNSLGWHICLRIEEPAVAATPNPGCPVGIDRGVVHTLALSDGRTLDVPSLLTPGEQRRLLGLERKAARQQLARKRGWIPGKLRPPMSKRHRRTTGQIATLRAREARRREDWLHKTTSDLAKSHGLIAVEDLRVTNMTRSAHGSIQQPGRNVQAKARLNRSILGMAWGKAERMLAYKCPLFGGTLVKVDPRNSSIECSRCAHIARENRVSQAAFRCVACGHVANADSNAAQIVLKRGLTARSGATPGCGGTAREARATVPHREPFSLR
jgi:putative transposase